jgi:hypothetical protein
MATTQLADVIVPKVFSPYTQEMSISTNALIQRGLIRVDPRLSALVEGGGQTIDIPFTKSIARGTSKVGTSDPADVITATKLATGKMVGARSFRTEAWSNAELAGLLAGIEPTELIAGEVAEYWNYNYQQIMLAQLAGVFADNVTNDGGDMVTNIYQDVVAGSITDAMKISGEAIIEAKHTMGDKNVKLVAIAMHSKVKKQLELLEPNNFVPKSQTNLGFDTYQRLLLIEDDDMPVTTGSNSDAYTSYLFGEGAIGGGFNAGTGYMPEAIDREENQGRGAGVENLYSRRDFILHPYGFKWIGSSTDDTPSNTEFSTGTNWDRVFERKNCAIASLVTNA